MQRIPHQLTAQVKLLQKVALWHQDQVLILQRASDAKSRPHNWDLPGGNSEWPTAEQAGWDQYAQDIFREVQEETKIDLVKLGVTQPQPDNISFFNTFYDQKKDVFTIIVGWHLNLPTDFDRNSLKISDEHQQAAWVKIEELDQYDFGGTKGEFVKKIISKN